jgi:hypothetical protein
MRIKKPLFKKGTFSCCLNTAKYYCFHFYKGSSERGKQIYIKISPIPNYIEFGWLR